MNERARKGVPPVRLSVLLPLVLGTLAGACFLVSAVVLGSITQARGPIEEHLPRIGALMLASFGGMLVLFSAAWAVLHVCRAKHLFVAAILAGPPASHPISQRTGHTASLGLVTARQP
jgi:hypothetical protein